MPASTRFLVALTLFASVPATARAQFPSPYRLSQLAPGVHLAIRDVGQGAADSNVLIIINESDVIVVDANIFPSSAKQMIAEIRKLTKNPVRYVINTHNHSDHHYGNEEYVKAFPGVEIIAHPRTREIVISSDIPSLARNMTEEYPKQAGAIRNALRTGRKSNGAEVTPAERVYFDETLKLYDFFLSDAKGMSVLPATLTVADSLVLHRGRRSIIVKHLGRGNTEGDLVVYLPQERLLATGDLVVHPIPYGIQSSFRDWPATMRKLRGLDVATLVPGHGEVQRDWKYVDQLVAVIESLRDQVAAAVARGADLEATRKAVNLDSLRKVFTGGDVKLQQSFDGNFVYAGVEAAYKELKPDSAKKND
jgi:cyclase